MELPEIHLDDCWLYRFLFSGWIMNLVKLVNDGDLQFDAGVTLARVVGVFIVPVGGILGFF
ncbi:TPA: hypothetical protein ACSQK4_004466 [Escherichia coli]|nr:hypothetical protein [Escherichia coli]